MVVGVGDADVHLTLLLTYSSEQLDSIRFPACDEVYRRSRHGNCTLSRHNVQLFFCRGKVKGSNRKVLLPETVFSLSTSTANKLAKVMCPT